MPHPSPSHPPVKVVNVRVGTNKSELDLWFWEVICLKAENNFVIENLIVTAQSSLTIASLHLFMHSRLARIILTTWIFAYVQMRPTYHDECFAFLSSIKYFIEE